MRITNRIAVPRPYRPRHRVPWHRRVTFRMAVTLSVVAALVATGTYATASYTVQRGDTLSALSRRFGVPVPALAAANGIRNVNLIIDGQVITVPTGGATTAGGTSPAPAVGGPGVHVVQRGESLARIAKRYGTTAAELARINGISNPNVIPAGARLQVPGGQWICPVRGHRTVVSNYGAPRPGYRRHEGNDIFARRGTPVVAPVSGSLRHVSGSIAGWAFYLDGDDGVTYYGSHLDGYTRGPGRVGAGERIGTVGMTGNAAGTGPHLHFEIMPKGGRVDPWPTLRRWC